MIVRVPRVENGRQRDHYEAQRALGGRSRYVGCTPSHFIFEVPASTSTVGGRK